MPEADDLIALVATWWPEVDVSAAVVHRGMSHDVVVVPDAVAVRFARTVQAQAELRRSAALLSVLERARLPFAVPCPLSEIVSCDGTTALATRFVAGAPRPVPDPGLPDPATLRGTLEAIAAVPLADVAGAVGTFRDVAGGPEWAAAARRHLMPQLAPPEAELVSASIEAAERLAPPQPPVLVHGDLAGSNLLWDGERLVGVLDWDLAFAGDQAYDVACLADGFGWRVLEGVFDPAVVDRARTYRDVFLIESYLANRHRGAESAAGDMLRLLRRQLSLGSTAPPTPE
jgi:aminoglycoside phosphotransferase (APT) family kinase protein